MAKRPFWDRLEDFLQTFDGIYPTGFEDAIIGSVERIGQDPVVLLDKEKCLKLLVADGMSRDDAEEYFEVNVLGCYLGENTPAFATLI